MVSTHVEHPWFPTHCPHPWSPHTVLAHDHTHVEHPWFRSWSSAMLGIHGSLSTLSIHVPQPCASPTGLSIVLIHLGHVCCCTCLILPQGHHDHDKLLAY